MNWIEDPESNSIYFTKKELHYFVKENFVNFLRLEEEEGTELTKSACPFDYENFTKTDSYNLYRNSDTIDEILITETDVYILKCFNEQNG